MSHGSPRLTLVNSSTLVPLLSAIFQHVSPGTIRYGRRPTSHLNINVGPNQYQTSKRMTTTMRKKGAMYRQSSDLNAEIFPNVAAYPSHVSEELAILTGLKLPDCESLLLECRCDAARRSEPRARLASNCLARLDMYILGRQHRSQPSPCPRGGGFHPGSLLTLLISCMEANTRSPAARIVLAC